ncbi:MAG TPA: ATP-binding protein, partial [Desulfuromonadaceae bacterium]
NPLASMSGSVQLLAEHGSIADSDRRLLSIVLREADRLDALIAEFLAYARPASPSKERVELRPLCDDMCTLLASDSRFTRVKLINLVPGHMVVRADVNQFRQVLLNLLRNAADAMADGGRVELEAHFQLNGADGFNKAPAAVITVTGSGSGISDETAAHLFEPFWTTKPDGSGLGLAITYRIIDAHGGTIRAESPPEGGCRITIMLPI